MDDVQQGPAPLAAGDEAEAPASPEATFYGFRFTAFAGLDAWRNYLPEPWQAREVAKRLLRPPGRWFGWPDERKDRIRRALRTFPASVAVRSRRLRPLAEAAAWAVGEVFEGLARRPFYHGWDLSGPVALVIEMPGAKYRVLNTSGDVEAL